MKKNISLIISILFIVLSFNACKKDGLIVNENTSNSNLETFKFQHDSKIPYSKIKKISKGFMSKNGSTEILAYTDMASVIATINDLDKHMQELDSAFVSTYSSLNEDELNDMAETIGFDATKPLYDFSNYYAFSSLHKQISIEEQAWLQNEELDHASDPDNHFIFENSLRAMLNVDCEIIVGDTIYKLTEDSYYALPSEKLSLLANTELFEYPIFAKSFGINFISNECSQCKSGCNSNKRDDDHKKSGKYRIKWVVSHWTHPCGRRVAAKTDNYKKVGGTWKKRSAYCEAMVYGFISGQSGDCSTQLNFNPNNNSKAIANNAKHVEHKIDVSTKTKSGWVKGYFKGIGGITHTRILTW